MKSKQIIKENLKSSTLEIVKQSEETITNYLKSIAGEQRTAVYEVNRAFQRVSLKYN
ncbi:hypothetical protein [Oceanirhabdus seepicola]|uniref:Uncharacterized protein n=1 Tax=Oceanirhabdus seepicola TaxID=2828781 RepID=A0A9J6NWP8_9CLOT|nr:hypothetical protein [Oceanirhabdus seepicola]MCM1988943.1 hypothetical protein [Oceanirhabdus seepicola]